MMPFAHQVHGALTAENEQKENQSLQLRQRQMKQVPTSEQDRERQRHDQQRERQGREHQGPNPPAVGLPGKRDAVGGNRHGDKIVGKEQQHDQQRRDDQSS